jgi:hypothetical protein
LFCLGQSLLAGIYPPTSADGISVAIPNAPRRWTPLTWEQLVAILQRPEKSKRIAKEGDVHASTINSALFPQAPSFTDCVRAVWHLSGENAKDPKQEK